MQIYRYVERHTDHPNKSKKKNNKQKMTNKTIERKKPEFYIMKWISVVRFVHFILRMQLMTGEWVNNSFFSNNWTIDDREKLIMILDCVLQHAYLPYQTIYPQFRHYYLNKSYLNHIGVFSLYFLQNLGNWRAHLIQISIEYFQLPQTFHVDVQNL